MSFPPSTLSLIFDASDYAKGGLGLDPGHFAILRERRPCSGIGIYIST